jgi:tetratricopeptide (TPR) repeat protein
LLVVNQALSLKADFEDALLNKGTILKALGKLDEAIEIYKGLTKANAHDDYAWNNHGTI